MIKYIFLFLVIVGATAQSTAQIKATVQPSPPGKSDKPKVARPSTAEAIAKSTADNLKKTLGLSEKQRASIYKAVYEHNIGVNQIKNAKLANKDKYNKTIALDQAKSKKFEAIMTKEQYRSYIMTFP